MAPNPSEDVPKVATATTGHRLTPVQRSHLLNMIIDGDMSNAEIAEWLDCNPRTVQRARLKYAAEGPTQWFQKAQNRFNALKLFPWAEDKLIDELTCHPDLSGDEMQWFLAQHYNIHVARSTISLHLKAHNWSREKLKAKAAQQDPERRNLYRHQISNFTSDMFVFVDTSGIDQRDVNRRHGWAPKDHTPFTAKILKRGSRFSILPAITVDGILHEATLIYQGSTTTESFEKWLRQMVAPHMKPFPGPRSVLVMDNAGFHHSPEIYNLERDFGIKLQYLPPYSPEYNPNEAFFGMLKAYIRRQGRWKLNDFASDDEFGQFLRTCVKTAGDQSVEIRGLFKNACAGRDLVEPAVS